MKILIVLSALLLIPIVMKFQERSFLEKSVPRTQHAIMEVLSRHGVVEPAVVVDYLNVTIAGKVETGAEVHSIGREVDAIRGVQLVSNQLVSQGWFEIRRSNNQLVASGIVLPGWENELLKGQSAVEASKLQTSGNVRLAGKSAASWGLMIDSFFEPEGDRALSLRNNGVTLEGEATPSQAAGWTRTVRKLVPNSPVAADFVLFPSKYHFASRPPESPLEGEPLRSISRALADSIITFEPVLPTPTAEGAQKLNDLAPIILKTHSEVRFVVGGHPDAGGNALAARRAEAVKRKLVEAGIPANRLQVVPFEVTEDRGELSGRVELLIL